MNSLTKKPKYTWVLALTISVIAVVSGATLSKVGITTSGGQSRQEQKRVNKLPQVISRVRHLEVVNVKVVKIGESDGAEVEIRNNSDLAVMSVTISTKDKVNSGGVTREGFDDPDNPKIVIEPHGTTIITMGFGEMIPDVPLVVSAATFADGTEDGDSSDLEMVRAGRAHQKARREAKKGGSPE